MHGMLTITQDAVDAIKAVAPPGTGLRLSTADMPRDGQPALQVEVAEKPEPDDRLLEAEGAQVYLDPTAATLLEDKVLDARVQGSSVRFAIAEPG